MKLEGKKVLVVGAGKSGIAASELLLDKKIETVLYDGNKDLDVEKLYEKAPKLKGMPVLRTSARKRTVMRFSLLRMISVQFAKLWKKQVCLLQKHRLP